MVNYNIHGLKRSFIHGGKNGYSRRRKQVQQHLKEVGRAQVARVPQAR